LIFELIWRDYFKFIALKHGNGIFKLSGIKEETFEWSTDQQKFNAWAEAKTGIPFIDANMRELNSTGFMSNRGRQNVASFLVKELQLDWRMGAEYFESKLIDYDVASNYGNWMYIAGVGNDPRDRYFNVILQAKRYDPKGKYVKLWLPELKELEASVVHHPWTRQGNLFEEESLNYPAPLVKPDYWFKHY
jgi:deoxyribodipyrimidine photo-lyase